MVMNAREIWTVVHGMVFGFIFLLGFSGALYAVYSMKAEWLTTEGIGKTINNIKVYLWALAVTTWAAVFTGAWVVYPWYRAKAPEGADLSLYPRNLLLSNPDTAGWHDSAWNGKSMLPSSPRSPQLWWHLLSATTVPCLPRKSVSAAQ